jgi:hypothetical protein
LVKGLGLLALLLSQLLHALGVPPNAAPPTEGRRQRRGVGLSNHRLLRSAAAATSIVQLKNFVCLFLKLQFSGTVVAIRSRCFPLLAIVLAVSDAFEQLQGRSS